MRSQNRVKQASTPSERLLEYRIDLQTKTANYNRSEIYNCDETALYWDLMPSKTLAHDRLSEVKKSKNRVTIMLTSNAYGNKLPPLFIHKFILYVFSKESVKQVYPFIITGARMPGCRQVYFNIGSVN